MMPEDVSEYGWMIDVCIKVVLYGTIAVGIFSFIIFLYGIWRFSGKRNPQPGRTLPPLFARLVYLDIAILIFDVVLLAINGYVWTEFMIKNSTERIAILAQQENKPLVNVKVIGRQFFWTFLYPGKDNTFGTNDDFLTGNIMVVPVNSYVILDITSGDVLHSFFLPNFRLKYDAIPGMNTRIWFKPKKEGTYEIACAELCGDAHYKMRGILKVVSEKEYQEWLSQKYPLYKFTNATKQVL